MSLLDDLVGKLRKDLSHAVELCDTIQNNRHPSHHKNLDDLRKSLSKGPSYVLREANKAKDLLGVDVARGDDISRSEFTLYTTEVESINATLKTISQPHNHRGIEHPHFHDLRLKWEEIRDKIAETFAKLVYRLEVKEQERKRREEKDRKDKEEKERKEKEEKERKEKQEKERKKKEEKERKDKEEKERKEKEEKERKDKEEKEEKERKKKEEKERKDKEEKEKRKKEEKERKKREEKERKDKEEKERKEKEEKERKDKEEEERKERKEREEREEIRRKAKEDEFKEIERVAELLGKFQAATSRTVHP